MEHEIKHMHKKKEASNNYVVGGIVLVVVLLAIISFQLGSINTTIKSTDSKLDSIEGFFKMINAAQPTEAQPTPTPSPTQARREAPSVDMAGLVDDDAVKGSANAPVTIVEFSDFECPFCTRFYTQTLPLIEEQYIKTGKVKLVYRDFPLGFHANAQKAAEAAECAGEQGKYYDMHDKLFDEGVSGGVASFKQFAAGLGLDTVKFNNCLDSGEMAAEVQKDMRDGSAAGISGTPGFIINGQLVSGAQPFDVFKQVIDAELAK